MIAISRITRNSDNADVLREACRAAINQGLFVEIKEEFTAGDWWTTFKIEWPTMHLVELSGDPAPVDVEQLLRQHKK